MSSRVEYVGCTHEKPAKSLPMPSSLFCHWLLTWFYRWYQSGNWLVPPVSMGPCKAKLHRYLEQALSKLKPRSHFTKDVRDRIGCEVGVPHHKKSASSPFQHKNCRQSSTDLQSRSAGRYGRWPSTQTIQSRRHTASLWSHRAARRPVMAALYIRSVCVGVGNICTGNWTCGGMLYSESIFCLQQFNCRVNIWRRYGKAILIAAQISLQLYVEGVWWCAAASPSLEKHGLPSLKAISMQISR